MITTVECKGHAPKPPPPPQAPGPADAAANVDIARRRKGFSSTILTGDLMGGSSTDSSYQKTLLGG